jgi:hypothetical protein
MVNRLATLLMGVAIFSNAVADDGKLHFLGNFESGRIQTNGSERDGFYIGTLPNPQAGNQIMVSGDSDFSPVTNADTRVVKSEIVGGQTVTPRSGEYFLRSEVFRDKDYLGLNDNKRNKPRSKIYLSNNKNEFEFDKEGFTGFSVFVPKNFENELGVRDHRGGAILFEMCTDSSRSLVNLGIWVQGNSTNEAHWFIRTQANPNSVNDSRDLEELIDLGPVGPDRGKWTDFVFRYRFNPFSVTTNPAEKGIAYAKDQVYEGNKGILQIWKAEGSEDSSGNRNLKLFVDKVNEPVGLVPHATTNIKSLWRIYKYGWLVNPTTLTHSVWIGFDEIRQGLVVRDSTTFADVAPGGAGCSPDCTVADAKPKPPASLSVD